MRVIFFLTLLWLTPLVSAHKYFFGITDMSVNAKNGHLEIIHQLTLHDLEVVLTETLDRRVSADQEDFELLLQSYTNTHFKIQKKTQKLKISWVGFEISYGKAIIYQEVSINGNLTELLVQNTLLTDYFAKQINTVNFQDQKHKGSLTFSGDVSKRKVLED